MKTDEQRLTGDEHQLMAPSRSEPRRAAYVPLRHRRESYEAELGHLDATYGAARASEPSDLRDAVHAVLHLPTWYVGNGGTMAVAQFAAELHNRATGLPATATTSLGFINSRIAARSALVVISAGAKHPDTTAAVRAALERRIRQVILVTERDASDLSGPLADPRVQVVTLSRPGPRDGFLATNSVLNIATAFAAVHSAGTKLPKKLPSLVADGPAPIREGDDLVVLAAVGTWPAATDLETRLVETGLAGVQKTDFRNFAHGRHLGLSRTMDHVTVVALSDDDSHALAEATLDLIPATVPVQHLTSRLNGPAACLDLLVQSMRLVAQIAAGTGLDPARPSVPAFGRRLYHLDSRRHLDSGVEYPALFRKLDAASIPATDQNIQRLHRARARWQEAVESTPISGVVLDYDGTVCTTAGRFEPPGPKVQECILRLLEQGIEVGFASGRGRSLLAGLQDWIPPHLQTHVYLGMYNGAVRGRLDQNSLLEPHGDGPFTGHETKRFINALKSRLEPIGAAITIRPHQISVEPRFHLGNTQAVLVAATEVVQAHNATSPIHLKTVASAHSADIIPIEISKNLLRGELAGGPKQGSILAIGDQGEPAGNDFELLAADKLTLSVDAVSGDPTRCWNLANNDEHGPALLVRYLSAIRRNRARVHTLRWDR